jgi:hypothetical protein
MTGDVPLMWLCSVIPELEHESTIVTDSSSEEYYEGKAGKEEEEHEYGRKGRGLLTLLMITNMQGATQAYQKPTQLKTYHRQQQRT